MCVLLLDLFSYPLLLLLKMKLQGALDSGVPTHLSYGFVSGFCSGYALKKVGRAVSIVLGMSCSLLAFPFCAFVLRRFSLRHDEMTNTRGFSADTSLQPLTVLSVFLNLCIGLGFVSLQTLSFYGYVKIDHGQMQSDFNDFLDFNKDGKVDTADGEVAYNKLMKVLQFNLPAGGGFAAGFVGGVRSG
jgi:uncharacterized membrane protein (Fun14 family)